MKNIRICLTLPANVPTDTAELVLALGKDKRLNIVAVAIREEKRRSAWKKLKVQLKKKRGGYVIVMAAQSLYRQLHPPPSVEPRSLLESSPSLNICAVTSFSKPTLKDLTPFLQKNRIDLVIALGGHGIVNEPALSTACLGVLSFHHGDPRSFRGPPPVFWERVKGVSKVGIMLQRLCTEIDGGDVLAFREVGLRAWDSIGRVKQRLNHLRKGMILEAVEKLAASKPVYLPPTLGHLYTIPNFRQYITFLVCRVLDCLRDFRYQIGEGLRPVTSRLLRGKRVILVMHNPSADVLDEVLCKLRPIGGFIPYSEIVEDLKQGRKGPPGFAVTFDDGYKENMELMDVLEKHQCPAIFFVATACLDSNHPLWFMNRDAYGSIHELVERLRSLNRQDFLQTVKSSSLIAPQPFRGRFGLTSVELRQISARGHEVGVHTHNHPFLGALSREDIRIEIETSYRQISKALEISHMPLHFAYPGGDVTPSVINILREMDAASAVTNNFGAVSEASSVYTLPRCTIGDTHYAGWGLLKMSPLHYAVRRRWSGAAVEKAAG